jgi:hypothetical protein
VGLLVPPDTAPGRHRLILGLYDPSTGVRLPLAGSTSDKQGVDALPVGVLTVR